MKFLKQSTDVRYVIEKLSKLTFFLVSQFLSFRHTKQNSKNAVETILMFQSKDVSGQLQCIVSLLKAFIPAVLKVILY